MDHTDSSAINSIALDTPYDVITTLNDKNLCLESFTTEWVNECYEDVTDRNNPTVHTGAGRLEGSDLNNRKWNCEAEKFFQEWGWSHGIFPMGSENDGKCVDPIKDRWMDDIDNYNILSPSIYNDGHDNHPQSAPDSICTWFPDNTWTVSGTCNDDSISSMLSCDGTYDHDGNSDTDQVDRVWTDTSSCSDSSKTSEEDCIETPGTCTYENDGELGPAGYGSHLTTKTECEALNICGEGFEPIEEFYPNKVICELETDITYSDRCYKTLGAEGSDRQTGMIDYQLEVYVVI